MNLEELKELNMNTLLDSNSKGGLVGLKNLGNTCFMNSALQCLSHCQVLTKYFLTKMFIDEVNKQNKHGTGGQVAKANYELLKELWVGSNSSLSPWDFRQIFVGFVKQFAGFTQQDSHEMLGFMLDRLHEDLNRIRDKPYVEMIEQQKDETDEQCSQRWWKNHKARENSIIVDLFHGQYKSRIRCPDCKKISITYDPFMYLSLSIPDKEQCKVRFKVFPMNYDYKYFVIEILNCTKFTSIKDLKNKIKENIVYRIAEFDALLLKNKELVSVLPDEELIYDYIFTRIDFSEENFIDYEIILVAVEQSYLSKNKGDYVTFFITPSLFYEERYYLFFKYKADKSLAYPRAFSISKKQRLKDLYIEVFKYYRRIIDDIQISKINDSKSINNDDESTTTETSHLNNDKENEDNDADKWFTYIEYFYQNIKNKEIMEQEFDKAMKEKNVFSLILVNNIQKSNSWLFSNPSCEYCGRSKCSNCKLELSLEMKIYELYAMQKYPREFILKADFSNYMNNFYRFYEEYYDPNDIKFNSKGDCTIYDCLELFRKEEKLEKENAWYCNQCDKHQEAFKKLEIYSCPKYLIIQFKRFKLKGHSSLMEMVNNKKNEAFIDFPVDNLDISSYVESNKDNAKYDLIAISQHFGGLSGGHYTALCRNKGKWYEFNDDVVNLSEDKDVVSPSAYLLFYEKKQ
jgi:ubiquitin carboxyl-terminal hydrolase 4/11/15